MSSATGSLTVVSDKNLFNSPAVKSSDTQDNPLGTLNTIPDELIIHILSFLKPAEVVKYTDLVCKGFRKFNTDTGLWNTFRLTLCPGMPCPEATTQVANVPQMVVAEVRLREKKATHTQAVEEAFKAVEDPITHVAIISQEMVNEWAEKYPYTTCLRIRHSNPGCNEMYLMGLRDKFPHVIDFELTSPFGVWEVYDEEFLMFFTNHPGLQKLRLHHLRMITPKTLEEALSHCKDNLIDLDLHHAELADGFLTFLSNNFHLQTLKLNIKDNKFTPAGFETLVNGFKDLKHVEITIRGDAWKHVDWCRFLQAHPKLETLLLYPDDATVITDNLLFTISKFLQSLSKLKLYACGNVSTSGIGALRQCRKLVKITMINCSQDVVRAVKQEDRFPTLFDKIELLKVGG